MDALVPLVARRAWRVILSLAFLSAAAFASEPLSGKAGRNRKTRHVDYSYVFENTSCVRVWPKDCGGRSISVPPGETQGVLTWSYEIPTGGCASLRLPDIVFRMPVRRLSLEVYGDGSGHLMKLGFRGPTGQRYEHSIGPVTWNGWRTVEVESLGNTDRFWVAPVGFGGLDDVGPLGDELYLDDERSRDHGGEDISLEGSGPTLPERWASGGGDPPPACPLQLEGIFVVADSEAVGEGSAKGTMYFRNLQAEVETDALEGLCVQLLTDWPGNYAHRLIDVPEGWTKPIAIGPFRNVHHPVLPVRLFNLSSARQEITVAVRFVDYFGNKFENPGQVFTLKPGETLGEEIHISHLPDGWYEATAIVSRDGATRTATISMGMLQRIFAYPGKENGFFALHVGPHQGKSPRMPLFNMFTMPTIVLGNLADSLGAKAYSFEMKAGPDLAKILPPAQAASEWPAIRFGRMYGMDAVPVLRASQGYSPEQYAAAAATVTRSLGKSLGNKNPVLQIPVTGSKSSMEPASDYLARLAAARKAAHEVNPDIAICGPSIEMSGPASDGTLGTPEQWQWLGEFINAGGLEQLDWLGIAIRLHWPEAANDRAESSSVANCLPKFFNALTASIAGQKECPIIVTGVGLSQPVTPLPSADENLPGRPEEGAKVLIHSLAHPAVKRLFWRRLQLAGTDDRLESLTELSAERELSITPMAAVYGHLAATLGTVAPEAETIAGDDVTGTYIYRFRSDRGHVIAAWTQAKGSSLAVSCNKPMELLNIMGSSMTIGTHFVTPLGPCPVLVRTTERCPFEIKANRIMTRSR